MKNCKNCEFFKEVHLFGRCHRYAPCQLKSDAGNSFMNVTTDCGNIGVEIHVPLRPTYLCNNGNFWRLIQFDDNGYAQEWLANNTIFDKVWNLHGDGVMEKLLPAADPGA